MNNHITEIEIKNFKKFEHLVVKNIGQFNLITGDNNVGKTSLLEVLILNFRLKENLGVFNSLLISKNTIAYQPYLMKKNTSDFNYKENVFSKFLKNVNKPFVLNLCIGDNTFYYKVENIKGRLNNQNSELIDFAKKVIEAYPEIDNLSENWLFSYFNEKPSYIIDVTSKFYKNFVDTTWGLPYISMKEKYDIGLFTDYVLFSPDKENIIRDILNKVFENINIEAIRVAENDIQVTTKQRYEWHNITEYGDGVLRIFIFAIKLFALDNYRIMIDEIDVGVHHSRQKHMWMQVLKLCNYLNVQLFATTHSQECIDAFVKAADELGADFSNDIRLIELEESQKSGKIYASTYSSEQIKTGINSEVNLRG